MRHGHRRKLLLAFACALCLAPVGRSPATEMPDLPQLIQLLRPPGERQGPSFSTTALTSPRARPAADEAAALTTAPEGTAAAALALPFPSGSAALTADAEKMLEALARALNAPELARYRFRIEGHTDTAGEAPVNLALSARRAAAVREHLVNRLGRRCVPARRCRPRRNPVARANAGRDVGAPQPAGADREHRELIRPAVRRRALPNPSILRYGALPTGLGATSRGGEQGRARHAGNGRRGDPPERSIGRDRRPGWRACPAWTWARSRNRCRAWSKRGAAARSSSPGTAPTPLSCSRSTPTAACGRRRPVLR